MKKNTTELRANNAGKGGVGTKHQKRCKIYGGKTKGAPEKSPTRTR